MRNLFQHLSARDARQSQISPASKQGLNYKSGSFGNRFNTFGYEVYTSNAEIMIIVSKPTYVVAGILLCIASDDFSLSDWYWW